MFDNTVLFGKHGSSKIYSEIFQSTPNKPRGGESVFQKIQSIKIIGTTPQSSKISKNNTTVTQQFGKEVKTYKELFKVKVLGITMSLIANPKL